MIIRWRIKSRDCSIELLMVCWQNDIAQICQNGLRRCCLVEEHAPQRSVPHNAAFWGVFYNRSSAVFSALRRWRNQMMMGGMEGKKQRRAMHAAVCNIDVKKLVFEVDNKVELVELLLVERSRSVEHNVATAVVFRERDAVAD